MSGTYKLECVSARLFSNKCPYYEKNIFTDH